MDPGARSAWSAARPTTDHVVDAVCVAPWVSIEFDPSGWVYACCTSGLYPLGRIGEERLTDLWGGPRAQVMRDSLRNWDLTVACGPCRWHLEHGRMDPVAAVYDRYPVSSAEPERPFMMLFALSNRCNLGCIMCTPELSTTLRKEAGLAPLEPRYDDQFFADLEPLLADLKLAKFLGGEPFLAPEHKRVWAMMDQLENPPRMQVTTNGTVWTDYVEWLLDRFSVDISISIDAHTAPTYEAIRRGGDHADLLRNVDRFAETCARRGTELHVSYCLMTENWSELADFLSWAERFDIPSSVNLVTDDGLALHDESLDALRAVRDQWGEDHQRVGASLTKNRSVWDTQLTQLDSVIAEREAGVPPAPRQSQPATGDLLRVGFPARSASVGVLKRRAARRADARTVLEHTGRLRDWSGGGPVGTLEIDPDGTITAVTSEHPRIGIVADELVGTAFDELIHRIELAQARPAWIVELAELDTCTVRTFALAAERPLRGTRGAIVRTIQLPTTDGWTVLLAEDLIYDDRREANQPSPAPSAPPSTSTPVSIGVKGSAP
ncbi:MAG: radical protein [Acidimicrobiales bacterium]|nr:radical protein [Acidimicrobiales bacterium]